jgi:hypothetical protein
MEEIIELSWKMPTPKEWTKQGEYVCKGKWRLSTPYKNKENTYIYSWCDEIKDWRYRGVVGDTQQAKNYCESRM